MNLTSPIRRVTIFCRNIEKSLRLYRDILGFTVIEEKMIQTQEFSNLMKIEDKDAFVNICYLQSHGKEDGLIALFEVNSKEVTMTKVEYKNSIEYGQSVIVLYTDQFDKIYKILKDKSYQFLIEPTIYHKTEDSPYVKAGKFKEMMFYDPDGQLVDLVQQDT